MIVTKNKKPHLPVIAHPVDKPYYTATNWDLLCFWSINLCQSHIITGIFKMICRWWLRNISGSWLQINLYPFPSKRVWNNNFGFPVDFFSSHLRHSFHRKWCKTTVTWIPKTGINTRKKVKLLICYMFPNL